MLDLFAGTGALGLEALSRGGDFCLFVENDTRVRGTLRDNCDACGVLGRTKIYRRDATRLGPRVSTAGPVFNLVFADPPYGKNWPMPRWTRWPQATGWRTTPCWWLKKTGVRVEAPAGFTETQRRSYGDTELVFLKFAGLRLALSRPRRPFGRKTSRHLKAV